MAHNGTIFLSNGFILFFWHKACSQIPQCSLTKTKVTKRLKAISVILLTGISTESRSGYTFSKVQKLFQVQQDLKTEKEMAIKGASKRHAF